MVLSCDVGGTKTSLALFEVREGALRRLRVASYPSAAYGSLDEVLRRFLAEAGDPPVRAAGFGVAGPVEGGRAKVTNLPWEIDAGRLASALGLAGVALLNDVEAHAWALEHLDPAQRPMLQARPAGRGTSAVMAVGTGCGFSALVRGPGGLVPLASEGGHADLAARDETELALLRHLRARHGHVSVERVLSGGGLLALYHFLRERDGAPVDGLVAAAEARGEGPAAVSTAGLHGRDARCTEAVELFLRICGAEAGNWALRTWSSGGIFLGGGVMVKLLLPADAAPGWRPRAAQLVLDALLDKGRFRPWLESIPVGVIADPQAALIGAAQVALSRSMA